MTWFGTDGKIEGAGRLGAPVSWLKGIQADPEGPTMTVAILPCGSTIVVVIMVVTPVN